MVAEDTKARIRAVAVELFTARGFEQTSLREVADRVGITKASLYYHYPSKQALLLALVHPLVDDLRRAVELIEARPHNPDSVRAALGQFLDIVLRHRAACAMFMRDTPAVLAAIEPIWQETIGLSTRLHAWIAGPDPTDVDRIRAIAASEVLGAALSSASVLPDVEPAVLRQTLVDCAGAVLGLPS
ncbi:helix-turn-helix domain containing protein [Solwaraspora sp. WMMD1047]|uniref:TetR/AcrR family transcriptional regulator n=1 Tax=Solwaraspora sp. WMMD1047 TaxID=3016102 RepID=UPI002416D462|nr:TetR/AcrR family transcriptional regulator [Solwaraspora sp. WMMD1047]MDG4832710.1 helix-turn-helix domain containing protein [Solwaraspora sp. WMMD1047]